MIKNVLTILITFFISISLLAQTSHNVVVASNSFTPSALTIEEGDTVIWTNTSGSHNVNGTITTFPSNPDSFGSGAAASGGWTYSYVFTIAGSYDYRCDPHAGGGMTATIAVSESSVSINESKIENGTNVYPNPFTSYLTIALNQELINDNSSIEFVLYDLLGNQVHSIANVNAELTKIETNQLSNGIYIFSFKSNGKTLRTGKLINN
ncbi:MAG: T9SS type A sorting domain-containing protein [Flavobacteriales bacterium]|nr:T9SS type A sorting domain-containing protein [Flavobacteriales bacterium]